MKAHLYFVIRSKIFGGAFWLYLDNFGRIAMNIAVLTMVARYLGPADFGLLNYATALVALFLPLGTFGFDNPATAMLVNADGEEGEILGALIGLRFVTATASFVLCVIYLMCFEQDHRHITVILAAALNILTAAPNFFDLIFRARENQRPGSISRLTGTLISIAYRISLVVAGCGVFWFAFSGSLEAMLASIILLLFYRRSPFRNLKLSFNREKARLLLQQSLPVVVAAFSVLVYMKISVIMLRYMTTDAVVGMYSVAQKLSEVSYVVPVVVADAAFPALVRAIGSGSPRAAQLYNDIIMASSILVVVVALMFGELAITLLFGKQYAGSVNIFYLHIWSCLPIALATARFRYLVTNKMQIYESFFTLFGAGMSVALNLVLIPRYGGLGAAISALFSYLFAGYLTSFIFPKLRYYGLIQTRALFPFMRLWKELQMRRHVAVDGRERVEP